MVARIACLLFCGLVALGSLPACSHKGEDACDRAKSLCPKSPPDAEQPNPELTCDPDKLEKLENAAEVEACIDGAKDCSKAFECILKARP